MREPLQARDHCVLRTYTCIEGEGKWQLGTGFETKIGIWLCIGIHSTNSNVHPNNYMMDHLRILRGESPHQASTGRAKSGYEASWVLRAISARPRIQEVWFKFFIHSCFFRHCGYVTESKASKAMSAPKEGIQAGSMPGSEDPPPFPETPKFVSEHRYRRPRLGKRVSFGPIGSRRGARKQYSAISLGRART